MVVPCFSSWVLHLQFVKTTLNCPNISARGPKVTSCVWWLISETGSAHQKCWGRTELVFHSWQVARRGLKIHFINWRQQPEFGLHVEKLTTDIPNLHIKKISGLKACESLHKKTQLIKSFIPEQETISQKNASKFLFKKCQRKPKQTETSNPQTFPVLQRISWNKKS